MTAHSSETLSTACAAAEESSLLILENTEQAFLLVDPSLSIVYVNRSAREGISVFLGMEVRRGMNVLHLLKEKIREQTALAFADALQGKRLVTENKFVLADGSQHYFEFTFLPAFNADGEISGVIISSKNITERKKAQKRVAESEERLQFALEAANQGVWDWNLETNEVIYSSSYKKLYGFAENELKNDVSEWMTRIHPEDKKKMQESVSEHLGADNPVYDSQYRIRDKDGRYRWVMARGRLISIGVEGKPVRMIGTHTDITEAIEREAELKLMNERFDCMMKATHELLWEWDIARNQIFRSKEAIGKVYGLSDDSSVLTIYGWLQRLHPEDRNAVRDALDNVLQAPHQHTFELEYRFLKDDGEYAHIYDRGILLKDEKDNPVRIIGSAQDISERKRLEKELLRSELEYQRLIHQATVDSQEKERAEIGKELHDNINQVLTTTKLYLDLAQSNAEMRQELVGKSIRNINGVIQEIRHLSRSLMDPSIGDLGLADSLQDLIESIHLTQKIKIELNTACNVEDVLDANQKLTIFRIVQESLNNVLRHAKATVVTININIRNECLCLTLQDDGVGFQPDATKKGAGLKNMQNRIYLINGTLHIDSKPDEGCIIQLQFPIDNQLK